MATKTAGSSPGSIASQLVHYLRFTVNYNDAGIGSGMRKGTAAGRRADPSTSVDVVTAFNAATTNVVTVEPTPRPYNNIVAAAMRTRRRFANTNGIKPTSAALGPLAADLDVYAMYTQTATAATAGKASS